MNRHTESDIDCGQSPTARKTCSTKQILNRVIVGGVLICILEPLAENALALTRFADFITTEKIHNLVWIGSSELVGIGLAAFIISEYRSRTERLRVAMITSTIISPLVIVLFSTLMALSSETTHVNVWGTIALALIGIRIMEVSKTKKINQILVYVAYLTVGLGAAFDIVPTINHFDVTKLFTQEALISSSLIAASFSATMFLVALIGSKLPTQDRFLRIVRIMGGLTSLTVIGVFWHFWDGLVPSLANVIGIIAIMGYYFKKIRGKENVH